MCRINVVTVFDEENFNRFIKREPLKIRDLNPEDDHLPYTKSYEELFNVLDIKDRPVVWGLSKCKVQDHKELKYYGVDDTKLYYVVYDVSENAYPHDYYDWSDHLWFRYADNDHTESSKSLNFIKEYKTRNLEASHIEQVLCTYNDILSVIETGKMDTQQHYMILIEKYMKK